MRAWNFLAHARLFDFLGALSALYFIGGPRLIYEDRQGSVVFMGISALWKLYIHARTMKR